MDWWQAGSVMGTVVLATTAVVTISWRVLAGMRQENRAAHDKIGEKITQVRTEVAQVRDGLGTEVAQVRDGLGAEIAQLRDGLGAPTPRSSPNSEMDRRLCARGSGRSVVS